MCPKGTSARISGWTFCDSPSPESLEGMLVGAYCEYAQRHRCCFMEWPGVELFSTSANGDSIHHSFKQPHASAVGPSAAVVAACEVFRRNELPGPEAHHAHPGPAYSLRKRPLPKHG